MIALTPERRQQAVYWLPAVIAGVVAWLTFLVLGHTPPICASGLALVIVGMALALRSMGAALTIIGALALAFSPSFWIQTGGAESLNLPEVAAGLIAALVVAGVALRFSQQRWFGIAAAVVVFSALFLTSIGTPRSLRLMTLLTAWLLYLLVDGLLVSNPRPDTPATGKLGAQHTYGLLIVLVIGVLNDPLFVLLAPAVALGLFLSRKSLPLWYWLALLAISVFGVYGVIDVYVSQFWWHYPVDQALALTYHVPYLIAGVWREPARWIGLMDLIIRQFTAFGLALGVLGLARLCALVSAHRRRHHDRLRDVCRLWADLLRRGQPGRAAAAADDPAFVDDLRRLHLRAVVAEESQSRPPALACRRRLHAAAALDVVEDCRRDVAHLADPIYYIKS